MTDLKVGDKVFVMYHFSEDTEGIVVEEPDRHGWVRVEQEYRGEKFEVDCLTRYVRKIT